MFQLVRLGMNFIVERFWMDRDWIGKWINFGWNFDGNWKKFRSQFTAKLTISIHHPWTRKELCGTNCLEMSKNKYLFKKKKKKEWLHIFSQENFFGTPHFSLFNFFFAWIIIIFSISIVSHLFQIEYLVYEFSRFYFMREFNLHIDMNFHEFYGTPRSWIGIVHIILKRFFGFQTPLAS
jgi:hypothetical protein